MITFVVAQRLANSFMESRILLYTSQLTKQVARSIDALLVNYQTLTLQAYFNSELLRAATASPTASSNNQAVVRAFLQGFVNSDRYVSSAYMARVDDGERYRLEDAVVEGMPYVDISSFVEEHRKRIQNSRGRLTWLPTQELQSVFGTTYQCFAAVRPIRQHNKIVALLVLVFREDFFRERYRDVRLDSDELNYLVAGNGTIVSSSDTSRTGMAVSPIFLEQISDNESQWFLETAERERYVEHARSDVTNWIFINEIPKSALFAQLVPVRNVAILIGTLFVLFALWLSLSVSRRITQPLRLVQQGVDRIGSGELTTRIRYSNNDDVGDLAARVNDMASQLEDLMKRISRDEKERQQERLRALQMQLSPHFMYNALNTMRWTAIINRQDNIKTMIDALIRLMKNIASPETEFTTLGKELDLLESYVLIQQMRYPGFTLTIAVPDELRRACINKFVLQNLVENSIVHGFSDRSEGGMIRVSAYTAGQTLYLVVFDNGVGFDPTDLPKREDEEHVHTGLASIEERVSLVHGADYGVELDSTPGDGSTVTVRMPLELQEAEDQCASRL